MTTIEAIVRSGHLELSKPINLPDGTAVEIRLPQPERTDAPQDDELPLTPEEIAQNLAAVEKIEPCEMSDEERATLQADRQARKDCEKAPFEEHADLNRAATVQEGPAVALPLHADRPPLRVDEGGVVRVGQSRISFDLVVEQYENGMTPEDMVRAYDTLRLADLYAVIGYYLLHRDPVCAYLQRRAEEAEALRAKIEAERPRVGREELLARRTAREKDRAPAGQ